MLRTCSKKSCSGKSKCQSIWEFRPGRGEGTVKKQYAFKDAFDNNDDETMDKVRLKLCWKSREIFRNSRNRPTNAVGRCKSFIQELSKNSTCVQCNSNDNIEFDHIDPTLKLQRLGKYDWWSWNGGVEAMKEELKKCRPLCRFCHDQQKTTHKRKYENIESMPTETRREKGLVILAKYRKQKKEYNIEQKIKRSQCKDCGLKVDQTNVVSFHWAHIDPITKCFNISDIAKDNTCFETAKRKMDQEIAKCELKCEKCHKKETDQRRDLLLY